MNASMVIDRARAACGQHCKYVLGRGGMNPRRAWPWNDASECDCSGFVAWCLGIARFDEATKLWYDTSQIVSDAKAGGPLFTQVSWRAARPSDLVVYPDRRGTDGVERQGHCGIVTQVDEAGPLLVVDCSRRNWVSHSDAIRETGAAIWRNNPQTIIARLLALEQAPVMGPA